MSDIIANPTPMKLGTKKQRCHLRDQLGYRSVEAMMAAFQDYVIVVLVTQDCGSPTLRLEGRKMKYVKGLATELSDALRFDTREKAEKRRAKIVEPSCVMRLHEACTLTYALVWNIISRLDSVPSLDALIEPRIRFYGVVFDFDGRLKKGFHLTPKSAMDELVSLMKCEVEKMDRLYKKAKRFHSKAKG